MKKIKYFLLLFPLLFITNVKAECTNLIDFNNFTVFKNGSHQDTSHTINSSDSMTIWTNTNGAYFGPVSLSTSVSYILSFDIETSTTPTSALDTKMYHYDSGTNYPMTNMLDIYTSSSTSFKYKFTAQKSSLMIRVNKNGSGNLTLKNVKLYPESDYDTCTALSVITYTYRFLVDNEIYSTDTVEENTLIELPESPTKEGYTFTGWTLNGEEYLGGAITGDIDIIANFTENQVIASPSPTSNVDFSVLIPYLILISVLILLIIEINFIRNLFKSRR